MVLEALPMRVSINVYVVPIHVSACVVSGFTCADFRLEESIPVDNPLVYMYNGLGMIVMIMSWFASVIVETLTGNDHDFVRVHI